MAFSIWRRLARVMAAAVVVWTVFLGLTIVGQTGQQPPLTIKSLAGRDLFEFYCASCHGRDGKGAGPAAKALRVPPADLTTLAARHDGIYPSSRIELLITNGQDVPPAHGSREMPVWGPIFRGLDPDDRLNRVRVRNIVDYLATIQTR